MGVFIMTNFNKKIFTCFAFLLFLSSTAFSKQMSTSVIIPCIYKHFYHVEDLLNYYEKQTTLPDEIVISLSEADKLPPDDIEGVKNNPWSFNLKIITSNKKQSAGSNRNIAVRHSSGDILILQDADDIPHPQRVEIIKYLFETRNISMLLHQWYTINDNVGFFNLDQANSNIKKIKRIPHLSKAKNCKTFWEICHKYMDHITFGLPTIKREVFDKVKWMGMNNGEDVIFTSTVAATHDEIYLLKIPLLIYRSELSASSN